MTDLLTYFDSQQVRWGIHPYTPVTIVLLFILGASSAVAHHFYYRTLNDTAAGGANRQQWVIQIGTGLAFLSHSALASVIGISRTQWVWATLRKRFISVAGIDALFGVTLDPTYFKNLDMIRRAKLATLMAVLIWVFPITAILTPGTISVRNVAHVTDVPCNVRTLLFEFDHDSTAQTLCCQDKSIDYASIGVYVDGLPSRQAFAERVLMLAVYSGRVQIPTNVGQYDPHLSLQASQRPETTLSQHCGKNCSYGITFLGPGMQCTENTSWGSSDVPWNSAQDFLDQAFFRAGIRNGVLWVGHFMAGEEPTVLYCRRTVSRYVVKQHVLNYQFQEPVIESAKALYTIPDEQPVYPDTTYLPNDIMLQMISSVISGNLTNLSKFRASDIALTPLGITLTEQPSNLGQSIEELAQVMVVSLLSIDTRGNNQTHLLLDVAALETTFCTTTEYVNVYHYQTLRLLYVYASSAGTALLMSLVGFVALARNGVSSSMTVSTILRTTRNQTLDRVLGGTCLGADPIPMELGELRLKFGEVRTGGGTVPDPVATGGIGHVALGIEGEVFPIRNGARYA